MMIALTNATLIDGSGGQPVRGASVLIEGSKILEARPGLEFGPEVVQLDLAGRTVMPGLFDCHTHFGAWFQWLISSQSKPLMYLASQTVRALADTLHAGCTTARDMGGLEAGFRDAVADGLIEGPRLQTALVIVQPTNGLTDHLADFATAITPQGLHVGLPGIPSGWCDGPDACRAKVREVLRYGADVIKIANDSIAEPNRAVDRPLFTQAELDAMVDEAHRAGVMIGSHAYWPVPVQMAVKAGVDSIEEGGHLDEASVEAMAAAGTWYVTSLTNGRWWLARCETDEERATCQTDVEDSRRALVLARKAGVRIVLGTDAPFSANAAAVELGWWVEAGATPMEAIVGGTSRAAEFLRMDHLVGSLVPGKEADLLVVDGDPLADITVLQDSANLSLVMKAGQAVSGALAAQLPAPPPVSWASWFA
jgi:imidazolonepropionase-like amidohydrolase